MKQHSKPNNNKFKKTTNQKNNQQTEPMKEIKNLSQDRMTNSNLKFKPSAPKKTLLLLAGAMWVCVGIMLILMAIKWLQAYERNPLLFSIIGFVIAIFIHHFGFLKIVNKNLERISKLPEKPCIFSFISWKSYLIIIVMVTMGITLRHSSIEKQYLSIIYLGIGLALFLSGIKYFRIYYR